MHWTGTDVGKALTMTSDMTISAKRQRLGRLVPPVTYSD